MNLPAFTPIQVLSSSQGSLFFFPNIFRKVFTRVGSCKTTSMSHVFLVNSETNWTSLPEICYFLNSSASPLSMTPLLCDIFSSPLCSLPTLWIFLFPSMPFFPPITWAGANRNLRDPSQAESSYNRTVWKEQITLELLIVAFLTVWYILLFLPTWEFHKIRDIYCFWALYFCVKFGLNWPAGKGLLG